MRPGPQFEAAQVHKIRDWLKSIAGDAIKSVATVICLLMHGGETFQLTSANFYLSQHLDQTRYMPFADLPAIPLEAGGIYWYGNIYIEKDKGAFTSEFDRKVIERSKELYPLVYTHLEPVNF